VIELRATRTIDEMPFLIDGHNLIPYIRGLSLTQIDDELALLEILDLYFKGERKKAVVFFDKAAHGGVQELQRGFVSAHFTRPPLNADKAIRNAVMGLGRSAANYTVVTSDHEVSDNARRLGAQVLSSAQFAQRLASCRKGGKSTNREPANDVDYWLKVFGGKS
jgi:predicted RNA-binding protein with PIN domain